VLPESSGLPITHRIEVNELFRCLQMKRFVCALLLALACPCGLTGIGHAGPVPEYTIGQLFATSPRSKEIRFAKVVEQRARIITPSWFVQPDKLRYFYFHETFGPQISALLKDDSIIRHEEVDRFLRKNIGRIRRASFYREGFVTLQLADPDGGVIIPVSLLTVRRSEEAVRKHLELTPGLFQ
jgi:hypothetical protein